MEPPPDPNQRWRVLREGASERGEGEREGNVRALTDDRIIFTLHFS
jgi:hypothetical protein